MSLILSYHEYFNEVNRTAQRIAEEAIRENNGDRSAAEEAINDHMLHEAIDGHELVIYYVGNDTILNHSSNECAWEDCYGAKDIGQVVIDKGMAGARTVQAFFAMEADVREVLDGALDDAEEEWKAAHPETDADA